METTLNLEFRRGGDWFRERDERYLCRAVSNGELQVINACNEEDESFNGGKTSVDWEYALIEKIGQVPLVMEWYSTPDVYQMTDDKWAVSCTFISGAGVYKDNPIRVHGATRREAIELFNALALAMGVFKP